MIDKLQTVYTHSVNRLTTVQETRMEKISKVKDEGMQYAEKRCRKLAMGEVEFPPEQELAKQRKVLWKLVVNKKRGGRSIPRRSNGRLGVAE